MWGLGHQEISIVIWFSPDGSPEKGPNTGKYKDTIDCYHHQILLVKQFIVCLYWRVAWNDK